MARKPLGIQVSPLVWREAPIELTQCLMRDRAQWAKNKTIRVGLRFGNGDALVSRLRSMIASEFIDMGRDDVLVMIDHDTVWSDGDVERIARQAHACDGIVGGMVPKRGKGQGIASFPVAEVELQQGKSELVEATFVGSAFCAYSAKAMRHIVDHYKLPPCVGFGGINSFYPLFLPMPIESKARPGYCEYLSEDYALCVRAQLAGVPVYLDQKPVLKHMDGNHAWTVAEAMDGARKVGGIDPLGLAALKEHYRGKTA